MKPLKYYSPCPKKFDLEHQSESDGPICHCGSDEPHSLQRPAYTPGCYHPRTHATENCWAKEKEKLEKHKAEKVKEKAKEKAIDAAWVGNEPDSDSEPPPKSPNVLTGPTWAQRAHMVLKATSHHIRSYHGKESQELFSSLTWTPAHQTIQL